MPDLSPKRRPPLASEPVRLGDLLLEAPGGTVLQLLGHPGEPPSDFDRAELGGSAALRPAGPGQWLLVVEEELSDATITGLAARVAPRFDVVDQSSGRVRIRISGAPVRRLLAKAVALDIHPDRFPIGAGGATLVGRIGVHLARTGPDAYEMLVLRSFAASLWGDLLHMSREFA